MLKVTKGNLSCQRNHWRRCKNFLRVQSWWSFAHERLMEKPKKVTFKDATCDFLWFLWKNTFFPKIWVTKVGAWHICECCLYAGVYGSFKLVLWISSFINWQYEGHKYVKRSAKPDWGNSTEGNTTNLILQKPTDYAKRLIYVNANTICRRLLTLLNTKEKILTANCEAKL